MIQPLLYDAWPSSKMLHGHLRVTRYVRQGDNRFWIAVYHKCEAQPLFRKCRHAQELSHGCTCSWCDRLCEIPLIFASTCGNVGDPTQPANWRPWYLNRHTYWMIQGKNEMKVYLSSSADAMTLTQPGETRPIIGHFLHFQNVGKILSL